MEYFATMKRASKGTLIEFPDCDGCVVHANPKSDPVVVATEALENWLLTELQGGYSVPAPKSRKGTPIHVNTVLALALEFRRARIGANLTQPEVAAKLGASRQLVAKMEHGHYSPRIELMERAAAAIGMVVSVRLEKPKSRR